jgi:ADP-ribose pyrophosphatase YjhB (NUDIX family)
VWDALGGKPETGETLLDGLVREVREEAGVVPLDVVALGCFSDGERADAFYLATAWLGEPRNTEPAEHSELAWVPLWEAAGRRLAPTTRAALGRVLEALPGRARS